MSCDVYRNHPTLHEIDAGRAIAQAAAKAVRGAVESGPGAGASFDSVESEIDAFHDWRERGLADGIPGNPIKVGAV